MVIPKKKRKGNIQFTPNIQKYKIKINIQRLYKNLKIILQLLKIEFLNLRIPENIFLLLLVQIKGWDGPYRIEETELACAISRKCVFGWKKYDLLA